MAKTPRSQTKKPADLTQPRKKKEVELKEDELGRVTGGAVDGYLKLDYKE